MKISVDALAARFVGSATGADFELVPQNQLKADDLFIIEGDLPFQITYFTVLDDAAPDGTIRYRRHDAGTFGAEYNSTPFEPDHPVTVLRGPFLATEDDDDGG